MFNRKIIEFIDKTQFAYVATTDATGQPHLAAGHSVSVQPGGMLEFENWFCMTTLKNISQNPNISIAVASPATGKGFQFIGVVIESADVALLDGYAPGLEQSPSPQALTRLTIRVDQILEFSPERHTDSPIEIRRADCPDLQL